MDNDIGQVKIHQISCCTTDGPEVVAIYEVEIFQGCAGRICWKSKEVTLWGREGRHFAMLMILVGQGQSGLRRSLCAFHCLPFQLYLARCLQDLHTPGTRSSFNQTLSSMCMTTSANPDFAIFPLACVALLLTGSVAEQRDVVLLEQRGPRQPPTFSQTVLSNLAMCLISGTIAISIHQYCNWYLCSHLYLHHITLQKVMNLAMFRRNLSQGAFKSCAAATSSDFT